MAGPTAPAEVTEQAPMSSPSLPPEHSVLLDLDGLDRLIRELADAGYQVIGPQASDGAIVYEPLESAEDLPIGYVDEQDGGRYRLARQEDGAARFDHVVGPHSWKRYLYPARSRLWRATRGPDGVTFADAQEEVPAYAFIGVRPCELRAIEIQDKVFNNDQFADPGYAARRARLLTVVVNCGRPSGTCFCVSQGTGPRSEGGFDLALTELVEHPDGHGFLAEAGSERGRLLLERLSARPATAEDRDRALEVSRRAAAGMGREMVEDVAALLRRNVDHARWEQVAQRCLRCGNCTLACPTCFCSTTEDTTDLSGDHAERWRAWDSCFTTTFSYIHGGSVRQSGASRYRQWITHKLSYWYDQFDVSGCVGCGRCITWCPVGIDITEEARAIRDSEGRS